MAITQPSDGFVRTNEIRCRNVQGRLGVLDQKWVDSTGKRFEWVALPIVDDWQDGLTEWEGETS